MRKKSKKRNQDLTESVRVIEQDLRDVQTTDPVAMMVMEIVEEKVSPMLFELLYEMLLGFTSEMQLEIADNLLDFAHGHVIHKTGCLSVDSVLGACYCWIAEEQGIAKDKITEYMTK